MELWNLVHLDYLERILIKVSGGESSLETMENWRCASEERKRVPFYYVLSLVLEDQGLVNQGRWSLE